MHVIISVTIVCHHHLSTSSSPSPLLPSLSLSLPSPSLPSPRPPQVNDQCVVTQSVKENLYKSYPAAKRAHLKDGGNFPYLSRCEEVVLHLQVSQADLGTLPALQLLTNI